MPTPLRERHVEPVSVVSDRDFYDALRLVTEGKKITRRVWGNQDCVFLYAERLHLRKTDGTLHQWLVSQGDLEGIDWCVVQEQ